MNEDFLKTKKEIIYWLDSLYIDDYIVNDDLTVNVYNKVYINKKMPTFKAQFNEVEGSFVCSNIGLVSLKGAPKITKDTFNCSDNELMTLEYAPHVVGGNFICSFNKITSLKGSPLKVGRLFEAASNQLINLDYCPQASIIDLNENPIKKIGNNIIKFKDYFSHSCFTNPVMIEEFKSYYEKNKLSISYELFQSLIEKQKLEQSIDNTIVNHTNKKMKL